MTLDDAQPKLLASALAELMAAGLTGDELIAAVARLEADRDRVVIGVVRHVTLELERTKDADRAKKYRDRIKHDRHVTAQKFADSPIASVASGPRPHNPLGHKSKHLRRTEVTASVMGDPEPGRSALSRRLQSEPAPKPKVE
jgi:hypothetical protein